jgi:hypothetical protein
VLETRSRLGCRQSELCEPELMLDFAAAAVAGAKSVASQQSAGGAVFPQRCCGEESQAVGVRALDREAGEGRADASPLEHVGDLDSDFCDPRSISNADVPGDTDERVVALVDRGDGLMVTVIDIGEVGELAC